MKRCAIITCPHLTFVNGTPHHFCPLHQLDYEASPEAKNPRPSSLSDFRDRTWKELQSVRAAAKWADASPEQRAEWMKGGFGR